MKIKREKKKIFLKIKIRLKNTSNDFFRNTFYSLLTFTLGTFITTSSDVIYEVEFSNHDKNQTLKKEYKTNSTFGLWAIMPPLIGLVSTIGGTLLNNYRTPDKLERNCLNDPPGKIRKVLEESQENYCKNYKEILTNSFLEIEPEFLKDINSLIKEDNNEN